MESCIEIGNLRLKQELTQRLLKVEKKGQRYILHSDKIGANSIIWTVKKSGSIQSLKICLVYDNDALSWEDQEDSNIIIFIGFTNNITANIERKPNELSASRLDEQGKARRIKVDRMKMAGIKSMWNQQLQFLFEYVCRRRSPFWDNFPPPQTGH